MYTKICTCIWAHKSCLRARNGEWACSWCTGCWVMHICNIYIRIFLVLSHACIDIYSSLYIRIYTDVCAQRNIFYIEYLGRVGVYLVHRVSNNVYIGIYKYIYTCRWQMKYCPHQLVWGWASTGVQHASIYIWKHTHVCCTHWMRAAHINRYSNTYTCMCASAARIHIYSNIFTCQSFWVLYASIYIRIYAHVCAQTYLVHINCYWGGRVVGAQSFDKCVYSWIHVYTHVWTMYIFIHTHIYTYGNNIYIHKYMYIYICMWQKKHCSYQLNSGRARNGFLGAELINTYSNIYTCMCANKPCPHQPILGWVCNWCTDFSATRPTRLWNFLKSQPHSRFIQSNLQRAEFWSWFFWFLSNATNSHVKTCRNSTV